ncbi:putative protein-tyrosine phosphatase [Helianthus anomalus]
MALFKRLDCIWPLDGLIEISEKVYYTYLLIINTKCLPSNGKCLKLFRFFYDNLRPYCVFFFAVFYCCVSTKVLKEDEYKVYMDSTVADLQARYSGLSFMVFNFKEGDTRTQISNILSQYDMTVMEYPLQYDGCPVLPLEVIHHVLRRSESWLSVEGQQNTLLLHCESGGWPVLTFMLAALVVFRDQYSAEQKTFEIFYKFVS